MPIGNKLRLTNSSKSGKTTEGRFSIEVDRENSGIICSERCQSSLVVKEISDVWDSDYSLIFPVLWTTFDLHCVADRKSS